MTTKNDYQGFRRYAAGMHLRNLSPGLSGTVTEENMLETVRTLADFVSNVLAVEFERLGLFINDDGEVTRISQEATDRLQDYFDERYTQIP